MNINEVIATTSTDECILMEGIFGDLFGAETRQKLADLKMEIAAEEENIARIKASEMEELAKKKALKEINSKLAKDKAMKLKSENALKTQKAIAELTKRIQNDDITTEEFNAKMEEYKIFMSPTDQLKLQQIQDKALKHKAATELEMYGTDEEIEFHKKQQKAEKKAYKLIKLEAEPILQRGLTQGLAVALFTSENVKDVLNPKVSINDVDILEKKYKYDENKIVIQLSINISGIFDYDESHQATDKNDLPDPEVKSSIVFLIINKRNVGLIINLNKTKPKFFDVSKFSKLSKKLQQMLLFFITDGKEGGDTIKREPIASNEKEQILPSSDGITNNVPVNNTPTIGARDTRSVVNNQPASKKVLGELQTRLDKLTRQIDQTVAQGEAQEQELKNKISQMRSQLGI